MPIRVACVQTDVHFADPSANVAIVLARMEEVHEAGADLVIFPECALTGYCVEDAESADHLCLSGLAFEGTKVIQYPAEVADIVAAAERLKLHVVFGLAGAVDGKRYNLAFLVEPTGAVHRYAKAHLPELGFDNFVTPGPDLPVFDTAIGKIGMLICFDIRMPEAMRVMMLQGAEIIALPTNWPTGAEISAQVIAPARAAENRVFLATCNRVGDENGFHFIGQSGIFGLKGEPLAQAGTGEEIIFADINPADAQIKRTITVPGKHETTVVEARRPELYRDLTDPA